MDRRLTRHALPVLMLIHCIAGTGRIVSKATSERMSTGLQHLRGLPYTYGIGLMDLKVQQCKTKRCEYIGHGKTTYTHMCGMRHCDVELLTRDVGCNLEVVEIASRYVARPQAVILGAPCRAMAGSNRLESRGRLQCLETMLLHSMW